MFRDPDPKATGMSGGGGMLACKSNYGSGGLFLVVSPKRGSISPPEEGREGNGTSIHIKLKPFSPVSLFEKEEFTFGFSTIPQTFN